jgi:predicted MFS family arabinose efflux permease
VEPPLTASAAPAPPPPPSLWRHGDFNLLWAGQTVSVIGSGITELALPTLAVLQLHAGPLQVGLLAACQRFAFPLLSLPVGVLADRVSRRRLMLGADLGRCLLLGAIPVLSAFGALHLWQLYVLATLTGGLSVVFDLAYLAYMPSLVGRAHLADANARLEFSFSAANIGGPGIGGLMVQAVGAARTMALDAASYLVSAAMLLLIGRREMPPAPHDLPPFSARQMRSEIVEGVRVVRRDPMLRSLLLTMGGFIFGAHCVDAVVVVYAYRTLHFSPGTLGAVFTLTGVGSIFGAAGVGAIRRRLGVGRTIVATGVACGLSLVAIPIASLGAPVAVLSITGVLRGAFGTINNTTQVTLRQLATADRLHARMNAVFRTVYWGAWPLGDLVGGALGSLLGLVPAMLIGGILGTLSMASMLMTPAGRVRSFPERH